MDRHTIANDRLTATILARGAELISLRHVDAGEMLWQAGPAWPKHAPVLFPVVGSLANDTLRYRDRTYPMSRHGFARDREFAWVATQSTSCTQRLVDDERTRAQYPFAFEFRLSYTLDGASLVVRYAILNPGTEPLPVSFGAHPAFRWPLAPGVAADAHALMFERDEPGPIHRLAHNLLDPQPLPTPVAGKTLALDHDLFENDAIVMLEPRSASVRFAAPNAPEVEVAWSGFAQLGLWSKPGGDFLCIEPWRGYASPRDFDGDITEKPGIVTVAPGATTQAEFRVTIRSAPASRA